MQVLIAAQRVADHYASQVGQAVMKGWQLACPEAKLNFVNLGFADTPFNVGANILEAFTQLPDPPVNFGLATAYTPKQLAKLLWNTICDNQELVLLLPRQDDYPAVQVIEEIGKLKTKNFILEDDPYTAITEVNLHRVLLLYTDELAITGFHGISAMQMRSLRINPSEAQRREEEIIKDFSCWEKVFLNTKPSVFSSKSLLLGAKSKTIGSGTAGGLGAFLQLAGANIEPATNWFAQQNQIDRQLENTDLVIMAFDEFLVPPSTAVCDLGDRCLEYGVPAVSMCREKLVARHEIGQFGMVESWEFKNGAVPSLCDIASRAYRVGQFWCNT